MIELQVRRVPEYHDGVADELIHRAPFGNKGLGQGRKMTRHLPHQIVGVARLGDTGEICDVGKQDSDFLPHAAKLRGDGAIDDSFHDVLRHEMSKGADRALGDRKGAAQIVDL